MESLTCKKCGTTETVQMFYGKDECDKHDPWPACFDCRWPYIRTRIYGPEATGPPGSVTVPASEPEPTTAQTGIGDWS